MRIESPPLSTPQEPESSLADSLENCSNEEADTSSGPVGTAIDWFVGMGLATGRIIKEGTETAVGAVAVVGGSTIAGIERHFGLEAAPRPLTEEERKILQSVYGNSIDFNSVRVVVGSAGVFDLNPRPFTLGNTVYVKGDVDSDGSIKKETLVHEFAHVWQFQHGGFTYAGASLSAQAIDGDAAYDWQSGIDQGARWEDLNPEQQAQLVEDMSHQDFFSDDGPHKFVDRNGHDRTDLAETVKKALYEGRGAP